LPIVAADDVPIIRVGHLYRNGVYHEDRHNEALLTPLTVLYMQAVGRMFCESYRPGTAWSVNAKRGEALARLGYRRSRDHPTTDWLEFRDAADQVTARIAGVFDVPLDALREWLADDLVMRCVRAVRVPVGLLDDGMDSERMVFAFHHTLFWKACGADAEAMEREAQRDAAYEHLVDATDEAKTRLRAEYDEAERAYVARWHEVQASFRPAVLWSDGPRLGKQAERLRNATSIASLLERYERLDLAVMQLEEGTAGAVRAWDEIVSRAVDAARGK
jgi:hypothetical protein